MMTRSSQPIHCLVEGTSDEAVLRRLIRLAGGSVGPTYGKLGKPYVHKTIRGFNGMARVVPVVTLVDLDQDYECAPLLRADWLPHLSPNMCFRVAVRQVEGWLMADRGRLSSFLGVRPSRIPADPDKERDAKNTLVALARTSRRRDIREDMVPQPGSGRKVGPAYTSRLIEFVSDEQVGWRPSEASKRSESLRRCIGRVRQLIESRR